ncbi:hypothetical protein MVEN_02000500 [Mycena venus]|uniref:Uncharacterized protein n=1 Tax=Mycena venus TaxID=2733690 RepID=A0A8H6XF25_9AGAR|nr:hypothetical protein MVEN_02000500 [Mycena venus]
MHVAVHSSNGTPPDVTWFGEQTVQCSERPCWKVYTLDAARIAELRLNFLALKAESDRLRGIQCVATMQARKAAQKQQAPPATKPARKKAREENAATGKFKGRNDVLSAAAPAPSTVICTPPSPISSSASATSTPASVMAHSMPAVAPVEDDKYDPNLFQISAAEIYTDHQLGLEFRVNVRGLDHFDFTSLNAAKIIGVVPEMGRPAAHYIWYSALEERWLRVGTAVSLRGQGSYMMLWNVSVPEDACPGLLDLVTDALHSILEEADLMTEDGQSSDFEWDVSVPSSPSPASSSPLKRKWTSDLEEEGPLEAEEDESNLKRQRVVPGSHFNPIVLD